MRHLNELKDELEEQKEIFSSSLGTFYQAEKTDVAMGQKAFEAFTLLKSCTQTLSFLKETVESLEAERSVLERTTRPFFKGLKRPTGPSLKKLFEEPKRREL